MKNLKRMSMLLAVILVAISTVFCMVACSCSDDNTDSSTPQSTPNSNTTDNSTPSSGNTDTPKENLVSVTVVDKDGQGISGATVQICQGEQCFSKPIVTGNDGKGSREYDLNGASLKAKVLEIEGMDDYLVPGEMGYIYFPSGAKEITITVQPVSVNVVDQVGNKIEGAVVQLTQGEHAFSDTAVTDANGNVTAYIAIDGESITAVVKEVLSGNYEISAKPTTLSGYAATITVNKEINYTVTVKDILGNGVENVTVKLFDCEKGYLQKTVKTDEQGIAIFENMDLKDYYVTAVTSSPAYVITTEATDGKYYFAQGSTTLDLEAIELTELTYTVTLSNAQAGLTVQILDESNKLVTEAQTGQGGVATFTLPNGTYVAVLVTEGEMKANPITFVKYGETSGTITVFQGASGTQDNPIYIFTEATVELTANEAKYIAIPNAYRKVIGISYYVNLVIDTGDVTELSADEGWYVLAGGEKAGDVFVFSIAAEEDTTVSITVSSPGSYDNPIDLNEAADQIDGYETTVQVGGEDSYTVYYTYIAEADGTLKISTQNKLAYISINDYHTNMFPVSKGDKVVISVSSFDENDYSTPKTDVDLKFSFGEEKADYKIVVHMDGTLTQGVVVILYEDNSGTLTEVARGTTNASGEYVFENVVYDGHYVAGAEIADNYEISNISVAFDSLTEVDLYIKHKNDGSFEHPFEFSIMGEENVSVGAGGSVWYTKFVNFGDSINVLVTDNLNAVIKAYRIGESEPVAVSSIVDGAVVLTFPSNGTIYDIEMTTQDKSAAEYTVVAQTKEKPQGSSAENPVVIEESGTAQREIGTELTYFLFMSDEAVSKVTITVNGDATLYSVAASFSGVITNEVDNNTLVIEEFNGSVMFAIASQSSSLCEVTVTAE